MYIKSIVLDGFKSYGKRVEITGFDTEFNAVTGLNGTGKSNILDSICFVLGISNLSQVRAGTLQDLIFKNGQAGVIKATVSITFDNSDPQQCPPGYEDFKEIVISRQVIMGGKNKYWINGIIVPNKKVQDLFCSVQLNVNNPHFLIMQGRVTKVLNMKPQEILAMVEEAAGTRMYESKRQAAQKTIEKKESKLQELNTILKEEISPKLEKLRRERQTYLEFQRLERELGHMKSLYDAWMYYAVQRATLKAEEKLKAAEEKITNIQNSIESNNKAIDDLTNDNMEIQKETEKKSSEQLHELEAAVKEKEKIEVKASAQDKANKDNISSEEKKLKQLQKNLKEDEVALSNKENEMANVQNLFETLKKNAEDGAANYSLSQKKFEAVSAGMEVNEDGQAETLQEQLMNAKQQAAAASTEMKTASMELDYCSKLLKEKEKELGSNVAEYKKNMQNVENVQKEVKSLEASLAKINYSEERMNELQYERRQLSAEVKSLRDKVDNFEARRPYTKFSFRDPETNFNRKNVHGVVCKLFEVNEPIYCTALETAAGGRLYNVVVENDHTSKILLQKGQLQSRTTFIPLNKIQGGKIDSRVVKLAKDLVGEENVHPAISLINYDRKLQPAMEYIFGNVFICKDMNVAKKITFHDQIRKKCVTLDGDVTDPGGTLSGGARQKGTPVLLQINEVVESEGILAEKERKLFQIETEMRRMAHDQEKYESIKQRLDLKSHEYAMVKQSLEQTTHHKQQQEVQQLRENIEKLTKRYDECKEIEVKRNKRAKELETTMKDMKGHRDKQLKQAEAEMKAMKIAADKSKKEWEKREQEYETLNLEIAELKKAIETAKENIVKLEQTIVELKNVSAEHAKQLKVIRDELSELQQKLQEEKSIIAAKNKEIQRNLKKQEQLKSQNSDYELQIQKQSHEVKKLLDEYTNTKAKEKEISKTISKKDENNLRDASKMSDKEGQDLKNKISKTQEERNKLSRTINTKAQSMYEHEEKQYAALLKKIAMVEKDKNNLLNVMFDLDKQKKETIQLAFGQVKKDFGSIFGTLLPGSNATLKAPDGKTILDGLEVKVSLGGVWKESLSELSGGQRSLVALSLILAMLLFKPAPLYILDEVDAALDLSHTQNIGNMLKSHFKQSQFIIVSLKDGMFNNANVLFRTKFIDGMSTVTRTENKKW